MFIAYARNNWQSMVEELRRMRRGDFTPEEIQNFCHPLDETVTPRQFADGCAEHQRKLFGGAPDADAVREMVDRIRELESERVKWTSISWPVEEWLANRISADELKAKVARAIDALVTREEYEV